MAPDEAVVKVSKAQKMLELFAALRDRPLCHCFDFGWISSDLTLLNNETKKSNCLRMEITFLSFDE